MQRPGVRARGQDGCEKGTLGPRQERGRHAAESGEIFLAERAARSRAVKRRPPPIEGAAVRPSLGSIRGEG